MKILLLGATGRTGKLLLKQLLQRGHTVNALLRDKSKVQERSPLLSVFEGSTLDEQTLDIAMQGCAAVISALNISRKNDFPWAGLRTPKNLLSATIKSVIHLADKHQIKRIIVLSAWGVAETRKDIPWWFDLVIYHSNIKYGYQDHEQQEQLLQTSTLDWTAIRSVGLINSNKVKPVQVSINTSPKPKLLISRLSVANFAVDVLEQDMYIKQAPVIFN